MALAMAINLPVVQLTQVDWTVRGFVVPGSHGKQNCLLSSFWYHPAGHSVQLLLMLNTSVYLPIGHWVQSCLVARLARLVPGAI